MSYDLCGRENILPNRLVPFAILDARKVTPRRAFSNQLGMNPVQYRLFHSINHPVKGLDELVERDTLLFTNLSKVSFVIGGSWSNVFSCI